jgi:hypothetical protein
VRSKTRSPHQLGALKQLEQSSNSPPRPGVYESKLPMPSLLLDPSKLFEAGNSAANIDICLALAVSANSCRLLGSKPGTHYTRLLIESLAFGSIAGSFRRHIIISGNSGLGRSVLSGETRTLPLSTGQLSRSHSPDVQPGLSLRCGARGLQRYQVDPTGAGSVIQHTGKGATHDRNDQHLRRKLRRCGSMGPLGVPVRKAMAGCPSEDHIPARLMAQSV